jgi:hypothetical protein
MTRVNITDADRHVIGWYDLSAATTWPEGTRWDGSNNISLATGAKWEHETLVRTAGGRWAISRWSQQQGVPDSDRFITADEAREWLIRCEYSDDDIESAMGERLAEERGPGRPEVGPAFSLRFPPELLARVDAAAESAGMTRAGWLRRAAEQALGE